ncbi:MAG: hypothetical protein H7X99_03400 [Saprospiraceae bacterium]|nr:hypothetical protein [Saprospiraceae bacterium]
MFGGRVVGLPCNCNERNIGGTWEDHGRVMGGLSGQRRGNVGTTSGQPMENAVIT